MEYILNFAIISDLDHVRLLFETCSSWGSFDTLKESITSTSNLENYRALIEAQMRNLHISTGSFNVTFTGCSQPSADEMALIDGYISK